MSSLNIKITLHFAVHTFCKCMHVALRYCYIVVVSVYVRYCIFSEDYKIHLAIVVVVVAVVVFLGGKN